MADNDETDGSTRAVITVGDKAYEIRMDELDALDARDFRKETGMPIAQAFTEENADLDVLAALLWVHRRRQQPGLKFATVARELTYANASFEPEDDEAEVEPNPEI